MALGTSIGQPAVTALPIAWLLLLAAQQDRDDYDDLLARLGEAGRGRIRSASWAIRCTT